MTFTVDSIFSWQVIEPDFIGETLSTALCFYMLCISPPRWSLLFYPPTISNVISPEIRSIICWSLWVWINTGMLILTDQLSCPQLVCKPIASYLPRWTLCGLFFSATFFMKTLLSCRYLADFKLSQVWKERTGRRQHSLCKNNLNFISMEVSWKESTLAAFPFY